MISGPRHTLKLARKLRSEMSPPEVALWRELRQRPGGYKFRRQHPAGSYVLDFYCASLQLAIEVDGWVHDNAETAAKDASRSEYLRSQGVATLRIPAVAVRDDLEAVVLRIVAVGRERELRLSDRRNLPLHQTSSGPPPRDGED